MRAAVMGAGSWGTVFAMIMADAGSEVVLWGRNEETVANVNQSHMNSAYHPGIELPHSIRATTSAPEALADADYVVLAVPAQKLRENLAAWAPHIPNESVLVSLMKGVELGTVERMSEVIAEVAGVDIGRVAVVSGPNLATEIATREPAATTVACADRDVALGLQHACTTDYFRALYTTDVVGVEIAGAVKNVIALANGIAVGLGFGENSQASIMTRGLAEMTTLGVSLGANPLTFTGLAGVGDLVATCQSPLSRNRTIGVFLGQGMTVTEAEVATKTTSEGVKSCRPILELAHEQGVAMPITEQVVNVVHEGASPAAVLQAVLNPISRREQGQA